MKKISKTLIPPISLRTQSTYSEQTSLQLSITMNNFKIYHCPMLLSTARTIKKDLSTNAVSVTVPSTNTNIHETGGLPTSIEIAVGAPFMLTKNIDTSDHMVNGVIGTIQHMDIPPDKPLKG